MEKAGIDVALLPIPNTRDDLLLWVVCGDGNKLAVRTLHFDSVARLWIADDFADRAGEYPRMPTLQRFLTAGFESQNIHNDKKTKAVACSLTLLVLLNDRIFIPILV